MNSGSGGAVTAAVVDQGLASWHDYIDRGDASLLDGLIADGAVFQSPAVHRPQEGKPLVVKYLAAALEVLNNDSFYYLGEWRGEGSAILEFTSTLPGGIEVNGIDMIWWNPDALITRFKVMVRPIKGLNALIPLMAAKLAG